MGGPVKPPKGFAGAAKTAVRWRITSGGVRKACLEGRVSGAFRTGRDWFIPLRAARPVAKPFKRPAPDLVGRVFGQRTILTMQPPASGRKWRAEARCACGFVAVLPIETVKRHPICVRCAALRQRREITIGGVTKTLTEWASSAGISRATLWSRLRAAWPESALLEPTRPITARTRPAAPAVTRRTSARPSAPARATSRSGSAGSRAGSGIADRERHRPDPGTVDPFAAATGRTAAYSIGARFEPGDAIDHPLFGRGLVVESQAKKVRVRFADGIVRLLVQGRV